VVGLNQLVLLFQTRDAGEASVNGERVDAA